MSDYEKLKEEARKTDELLKQCQDYLKNLILRGNNVRKTEIKKDNNIPNK